MGAGALFVCSDLLGATAVSKLRYAPDVTTAFGTTPVTVGPADVCEETLSSGTAATVSIGTIPAGARLDGYAVLPSGVPLLSFDTAVLLGGTTFQRHDVVSYDAGAGTYALYFSASAQGVPDGVNLLDFDVAGPNLLLVFDTTFTVGGSTFGPRDVVQWNGAAFSEFFDAAAAGLPDGIGIDGLHALSSGHVLFSFDGSGTIGGVAFDAEDVLEYTPGTPGLWELLYDGSVAQPGGWRAANLGPFAVPGDVLTPVSLVSFAVD